jgi:uroporphyrin-III C-methyltransferase
LSLPWSSLADSSQTLVFYMGLSNLGIIAQRLIEAGLPADTPAALISNGTRPDQHVARGKLHQLPTLALDCPPGIPTLTVIGTVVDLFAAEQLEYPARLYPAQALQRHAKVAI